MQNRGPKRPMHSAQVAGVEMSRPHSCSSDCLTEVGDVDSSAKITGRQCNMPAVQIESKDMKCAQAEPAGHGWRSAHVPAVVPFKKRRIQVSESPKFPSPPPEEVSPVIMPFSVSTVRSVVKSVSVNPAIVLPKLLSANPDTVPDSPSLNATFPSPTALLVSNPVPPVPQLSSPKRTPPCTMAALPQPRSSLPLPQLKSTSPPQQSPSPKPTSLSPVVAKSYSGSSTCQCFAPAAAGTSERSGSNLLKPLGQSFRSCHEDFYRNDGLKVIKERHIPYVLSLTHSANQNQPSSNQELEEGEFIISMEKEVVGELPEVCSQEARGHFSQLWRYEPLGFRGDQLGWDSNTDMETWDKLSKKVARARKAMEKGSKTCESIKQSSQIRRDIETSKEEKCSLELVKGDKDNGKHNECGLAVHQRAGANDELLAVSKVASLRQNEALARPEIRNNALGIPNSVSWKVSQNICEKQGLQWYNQLVKLQAGVKKGEWKEQAGGPECEHVDGTGFDCCKDDDAEVQLDDGSSRLEDEASCDESMGDPCFWDSKTLTGGGGIVKNRLDPIETCTEKCYTSGRVKSSGWDQLPEGFDSAAEALKAAQEFFSRCGRWSWVNVGGRGSSGKASMSGHPYNNRRDDVLNQLGCRESYDPIRRLSDSIEHEDSGAGGRGLGREAAGINYSRGCFNNNSQSGSLGRCPVRRRLSSGSSSQRAAVAAARVQRSGFSVASDGTISRDGRPKCVLRSTFENSNGTQGQVGKPQGAEPGFTGHTFERDALAGRGTVGRYDRPLYGGGSPDLRRSESPCRLHTSNLPYTSSCSPRLRPESRVTMSRMTSPSPEPSKFYQGSARDPRYPLPLPKWSHDRKEAEGFRERELRRPLHLSHGCSVRTSPHVVHGSSLMDERDWRVLAGTRSSLGGRTMVRSAEVHPSRSAEGEGFWDYGKNSPGDVECVGDMRGGRIKRDRNRDDDKKREPYRTSSRCAGGHKCASSQDEDNDNPSRRQGRPSW